MARSILRSSRSDKHQRLFELIRRESLSARSGRRQAPHPLPPEMQAPRDQAVKPV